MRRGRVPLLFCVRQQSVSDYYTFSNFLHRTTVHQQYTNSSQSQCKQYPNSTQIILLSFILLRRPSLFVHQPFIAVRRRPFVVVSLDPLSQSAATIAIVRPRTNSGVSCERLVYGSYEGRLRRELRRKQNGSYDVAGPMLGAACDGATTKSAPKLDVVGGDW